MTASSHNQAVAHIETQAEMPDLLVSDYHLREDETGLDVILAARLRACRPAPAVLVSGDTSDKVPAHELECVSFQSRPNSSVVQT